MRADEPASRYFRVELADYTGWWKVWIWMVAIVSAIVLRDFSCQPGRVLVVSSSDGSVLYEEHRYFSTLTRQQNLQAIMESSTVSDFVRDYRLPIAMP